MFSITPKSTAYTVHSVVYSVHIVLSSLSAIDKLHIKNYQSCRLITLKNRTRTFSYTVQKGAARKIFDRRQGYCFGYLLVQAIGAQIQNIFKICARMRLQGPL